MSGSPIKETRHLVLPLQSVLDAVVYLDRRNHGELLRGEPLHAEFVTGKPAEQGLNVAVRASGDDALEWRHLDRDDLLRAIISYCRSRRIPLPFAGEKTLSITDRGAALAIENTVNLSSRVGVDKDITGQPLRYARGYEPHAITPSSRDDLCV